MFDMARLPCFELAGVPQHVVQRGNTRLPCFLDDEDRQRYLQCLRQALLRFGCKLHAYVLMSNHAHLLLTPDEAGVVSRMMHTFARNYVGMFNGRHGRTGTLWEGRYKACLVDSGRYFLACSRYIELNPVRAWMVAEPGKRKRCQGQFPKVVGLGWGGPRSNCPRLPTGRIDWHGSENRMTHLSDFARCLRCGSGRCSTLRFRSAAAGRLFGRTRSGGDRRASAG